MTNVQEFKELFESVRRQGYIKSRRTGNTGIGKTFEDACQIVENNLSEADFKGIEIKSQRDFTSSYLTLFTKSPTYPRRVNTDLRLNYGSADSEYEDIRVLHTSIFSDKFNSHVSGYGFKIEADDINQNLYLLVKDLSTNEVIRKDVYWSYPALKKAIDTKLNLIAYVSADSRVDENGVEEFYFKNAILMSGLTFEKFINAVKAGKIMVDIRIGAYKMGLKAGQTHDHGTGFRISRVDFPYLFNIEQI